MLLIGHVQYFIYGWNWSDINVLGLNIANKTSSDRDVTVKLESNTSNRTGSNDVNNENVIT